MADSAQTIGSLVCIVVLGIAGALYSLSPVLQKICFVPSMSYKAKILKKLKNKDKKITSKQVGLKLGSYRRRVVLESKNPGFYSTQKDTRNSIQFGSSEVNKDLEDVESFVDSLRPKHHNDPTRKLIFGYFHPYCNSGGGGERVLWQAVKSTLDQSDRNIVAIYTGDNLSNVEILQKVELRFNIKLDKDRIVFVYLDRRRFVDGAYWKHFTLIGQALGSIVLSMEAIFALPPDVWIDTMGYPFTYPMIYMFLKVPLLSYTHFPIIQVEMLGKLKNQIVKSSSFLTKLKLCVKFLYWELFMLSYSFVGYFIDLPTCNGTWTKNHLTKIWPMFENIEIVYPPCSTEVFTKKMVDVDDSLRENFFVCLAQFRPEKRHSLIITEFKKMLESNQKYYKDPNVKLVLIGSCRDETDEKFVNGLKALVKKLEIDTKVEFILNAPFSEIEKYFKICSFGINAMWNEHFGIAVVESIASGLIPISHQSAGPLLDIAVPWDAKLNEQAAESNSSTRTGLFFRSTEDPDFVTTKENFVTLAECMHSALELSNVERDSMRIRGRKCVSSKFSNATFAEKWTKCLEKLEDFERYFREQKGKVESLY